MAGGGKRFPGDVQPAVAGQELVGQFVSFQEVDQMLESNGVLRADVGSTTLKMLGVLDSTYTAVHIGITKTGVDDDRANLSHPLSSRPSEARGEIS